MNEFKYLKDAQCVRFDAGDVTTWHVFASEKDANRWKQRLGLAIPAAIFCALRFQCFADGVSVCAEAADQSAAFAK